jgi:hypothetical protein
MATIKSIEVTENIEYYVLAVPGHALLWLSLVKWKRKKKKSAHF